MGGHTAKLWQGDEIEFCWFCIEGHCAIPVYCTEPEPLLGGRDVTDVLIVPLISACSLCGTVERSNRAPFHLG